MRLNYILITSLLVLTTINSCKEDETDPRVGIRKIIKEEMESWNINALAIATVEDGKLTWAEGFGFHDVANQTPTSENTLFVTSSVAKLVIAVAVMQQVEQGKLDLDEDIGAYLGYEFRNPNFPEVIITGRQLMTQRSSLSLPTFQEVPDLAAIYTYDAASELTFQSWIPAYLKEGGMNYDMDAWQGYAPDTQHLSSNSGMSLLAYLVEIASGKDFRTYADDHIFTPLQMTETGYHMDTPGSYDDSLLADIFTSTGSTFPDYLAGPHYPAGLLRLSVKEWANFMLAILNKGEFQGQRILNEATVDEMLDVKYPNANLAYGAGVALVWRELNGWIGHTGGGFITASTDINVQTGKGVIIISNGRQAFTVSPDPVDGKIYKAVHDYLMTR